MLICDELTITARSLPPHRPCGNCTSHTCGQRQLVEQGKLELDAQGAYNGFTALHDAVWHGHTETARVFLEAGARLDLRSQTSTTPLELAIEYGYHDIAALIQQKSEAS